jgi:hypothetical protein
MLEKILEISIADYSDLLSRKFVVFNKDGNLMYLYEEYEKLNDVSKMPQYIIEDFLNHNLKYLSLEIFNEHTSVIFRENSPYDSKFHIRLERIPSNDEIRIIDQIRRDLKLKEILN